MRSLEKQCPYCGNNFTQILKYPKSQERVYCTRTCGSKATFHKRSKVFNPSNRTVWSNEELEYLRSLIGKKQLPQIKAGWNDIAKRKGWDKRSDTAIEVIVKRLCQKQGIGTRTTVDNWCNRDLAKLLDIPVDRVELWIEKSLTLAIKAKNCYFKNAIAKADLRKFAASFPELFWGIDKSKLSKALGDSKLAGYIYQTVKQPTVGRPMTIVRLDTGDVYKSAKNAALTLNLGAAGKTAILRQLQRETPMRNGMEFARLDYPLYWVPLVARAEFNLLAGRIFYEIYLQLRELDGYSKISCQVVAGRIAVQITLFIFRRNLKQELKGQELTPKQMLIEFWQSYLLKNLSDFVVLSKQQMWKKIVGVIKWATHNTFMVLLPNSTPKQLQMYSEEFAYWFIEKQTKAYFRCQYLPTGYRPKNNLETADLFAYIYSSIFAKLEIRENCFEPLVRVNAWSYIKKEISSRERSADLSGTGMDGEEGDCSFQLSAQTRAINSAIPPERLYENNDAAKQLDSLLAYIEALPTITKQQAQIYRLYVDLKLEEASDRTIAKTLSIAEEEVRGIERLLRSIASSKEYQQRLSQDAAIERKLSNA